ncbi:hypothetical protein [Paenisporosarcina sp. NPDC076898]|uniref:hypothetical protein n=1 Tax=unclassified Paenisporosarcina TaxID=2642018 RepID=UPI003D04C4F7
MLKTLKGKVIAGTVTLALVAGAGTAFANSNAGDQLGRWYTLEFGKTALSLGIDTGVYSVGKLFQFSTDYSKLQSSATTSINNTRDSSKTSAQTNIKTAKDEHITAINAKNTELLAGMEAQFDEISLGANAIFEGKTKAALKLATDDLNKRTSDVGGKALASVSTDLELATTNAKNELQAAIDRAKSDLRAKLNSEKDLTATEIKLMMDTKVSEILSTITALQQKLVADHQKLIADKALELENKAKAEMDAIVNSIR